MALAVVNPFSASNNPFEALGDDSDDTIVKTRKPKKAKPRYAVVPVVPTAVPTAPPTVAAKACGTPSDAVIAVCFFFLFDSGVSVLFVHCFLTLPLFHRHILW